MAQIMKSVSILSVRGNPIFLDLAASSNRKILALSHIVNQITPDLELTGIGIRVCRSYFTASYTRCRYATTSLFHQNLRLGTTTSERTYSAIESPQNDLNLSREACPQGIQGDNCVNFKLWLENCRRYGLENCDEQLQGIQTGRKTLAEVIAEQDKLIAEIAEQHRAAVNNNRREVDAQGIQDSCTAFPDLDSPCPQGVQGDDCARFKLWLENCHRFGLHNCMEQLESFKAGRQSLAEIFANQDRVIREAATVAHQKSIQQRRKYSTSTDNRKPDQTTPADSGEGEVAQLSQRQKLQRAVKEYGSTVIVFHVTISLMSLGFFYVLVSSGIDVVGILMKLGIGNTLLQNKLAAGTGTFVVAYAVHKVFAPVRIATTLTATPFIVRYLRRIGMLKVPGQVKTK